MSRILQRRFWIHSGSHLLACINSGFGRQPQLLCFCCFVSVQDSPPRTSLQHPGQRTFCHLEGIYFFQTTWRHTLLFIFDSRSGTQVSYIQSITSASKPYFQTWPSSVGVGVCMLRPFFMTLYSGINSEELGAPHEVSGIKYRSTTSQKPYAMFCLNWDEICPRQEPEPLYYLFDLFVLSYTQ